MRPLGVLDWETEAIRGRPAYPPEPVGVALRSERWKRGRYVAWGHPEGNNASREDGLRAAREFAAEHTLVMHSAKFDLDVAEERAGIPWPAEWHDTLLLAFLADPDSLDFQLKPLAERHLGMAPEERDVLKDWVLANVPEAKASDWGAYICRAPASVVGPYAVGDADRTLGLFRKFQGEVLGDTRFAAAYVRERAVTRTLVRMERRGLPIATERLRKDIRKYEGVLAGIEDGLLRRMKAKPSEREGFAWAGPNFARRLVESGLVDSLPLTEKGNESTSAESLALVMPKDLAKEFEVRSQVANCLGTFMRPWLLQADAHGGLFFSTFNQVAQSRQDGKKIGARTGRLSMTPNLQNVIRSDKDPRVPQLRDYVVPGRRFAALLQRDYSQQELRLLAHYEDGPFLRSYEADPDQDAHELVRGLIRSTTGLDLARRPVKDLNFGLIYGQGLALTAEKLGVDRAEAKRLRRAHAASLPGIGPLQEMLKERSRAREPIWTWGGRRYYCEPPKAVRGRLMNFEYKMLNKLIQGSAADVTKQAMVNYDGLGAIAVANPMLLQVHDELILGLADRRDESRVHEALRDAMADVGGIAVPMRSDGKTGAVSWHRMKKVRH